MYAWPDDAPRISPTPALEAHYRAAIAASVAWLEANAVPAPTWSGGHHASPADPAAQAHHAAIVAAIAAQPGPTPQGLVLRTIVTVAARCAFVARAGGFGVPGWAKVRATLQSPRS